jgi:hypothetical protein
MELGVRQFEEQHPMRTDPTTQTTDITTREVVNELTPGERVEIRHLVKVGQRVWTNTVTGEVVSFERRRHGLHFRRNQDDKVYSDMIVLKLPDGSLTTITMDEYTQLKKA